MLYSNHTTPLLSRKNKMLKVKVVEKQENIEAVPATLLPEIIDMKADLRKIVNGLRVK
jgi:hypothetical protein